DTYHPGTVYSSIDAQGRYAYGNQPQIAQWNLARLAETLLPLLGEDEAVQLEAGKAAILAYPRPLAEAHVREFRAKLGLREARNGDVELVHDLLDRMTRNEADFTLTFRRLADAATGTAGDPAVAELFKDGAAFTEWAGCWRARLEGEGGDP